jgi:lysophospholipase L1-like esterase
VKTILAYGDSNTWGAVPMAAANAVARFGPGERWTGVARSALGSGFDLIAEGLNGRTTCLDDPIEGRYKNGEAFLPVCLESHMPIDLVVVMLGTNDLKARFAMPAGDIANGAGRLVRCVLQSTSGHGGKPPRVLLACPAPVARLTLFAEMFAGAEEKSRKLSAAYKAVAALHGVDMLDVGEVATSSDVDGIHLDASEHARLGAAIARKVQEMLKS